LFLIPLLSFLSRPNTAAVKKQATTGLETILGRYIVFMTGKKARTISLAAAGMVFVACLGLVASTEFGMDLTYAIHNNLTKSWKTSELFAMEARIKDRFKAIYPCNIMIRTKNSADLKSPEILKKIDDFANYLTNRPDIGGTTNLATFIKLMNRFVHEENDDYFRVPDSAAAISEYLYLYDLADPGSFEFVVDNDYKNTVLVAYADNTSIQTVKEILASARMYAEKKINDENVEAIIAGGAIGICGANNEMIGKWLVLSIILSLLLVWLIVAVFFTLIHHQNCKRP
jgi:hypothetical protein